MYIDEHETAKAFGFLNATLNETQTSNITNLNKYLEVEEKILVEEVRLYLEKFSNYDRP